MADTVFSPIDTSRLRLRAFRADDLAAFIAYRSQPETARYQSWEAPFSRADGAAFLARLALTHPDTPGQWFQFAVERKADGRLIGDVGLKGASGEGAAAMELGYTLDARATGQGYATEAVRAVLDYALVARQGRAVQAWADSRHERSLALLARVGFARLDGPPRLGLFKGETCAEVGHVMTVEAWMSLSARLGAASGRPVDFASNGMQDMTNQKK